ncbi:sensor histidine kinase [Yinghuangia sp. YIM S09857]|uniref:sensor histidine kinase n=1 Tax=Yinghuangia sp. YIM S09857 TaxID=3436929 RepID=UPI003F53998E
MNQRSGTRRRLRDRLAHLRVSRRGGLRWMHLLLGAALLMPFHTLMVTCLSTLGAFDGTAGEAAAVQFTAFALDVPLVVLVGLLPVARTLEGAMARTLCGSSDEILATAADSWPARRRTSAWFTLHTLLGGIVGGISLAAPPAGALFLALPFLDGGGLAGDLAWGRPLVEHPWAAPLLGTILLLLPIAVSAAAGRLLARLAPVLLGPTPGDRLAAAEARAARMAEQARIARELHDSVGHALSAVGIQAAAASRRLDADPQFAAKALAAIEETARDAVAELDHVLGLLRDEVDTYAPRGLADLAALLDRTRAAGAAVDYAYEGEPASRVPGTQSREAYRIVQEGLGNALKHARGAPIQLRLTAGPNALEITMANPLPSRPPRTPRRRGGSGLPGMRDRVALLRGTLDAGPDDDGIWRLTARIPLVAAA